MYKNKFQMKLCWIIVVCVSFVVSATSEQTCNQIISVQLACTDATTCTENGKGLVQIEQLDHVLTEISPFLADERNRRCQACQEHKNMSATPRDCQEIASIGYRTTGVYTIYPIGGLPFQVRCDMDTVGGGWTVFQRRVSASDFYKTWNEYKVGFGDLDGNFWLGNDKIYRLTNSGSYKLRIDLTAPGGEKRYAEYSSFSIGNEQSQYKLSIYGYSGNAGDSLYSRHNGVKFSTKDRDNDIGGSCAAMYHGAWWYDSCHISNLNGEYGNNNYATGLTWRSWKGYYVSMVTSEMKIRRN